MSKSRVVYAIIILITGLGVGGAFLAKHRKAAEATTPTTVAVQSVNLGDYTGPPGKLAEVPAITVAGGKISQPPSTYLVTPGTVLRLPIKSVTWMGS